MECRKAAVVCCSNALKPHMHGQIEQLCQALCAKSVQTEIKGNLFSEDPWGHGSGRERAAALMECYCDPKIQEIYDVSGGDLSNEILPYLDFNIIRENPKSFWGYSDLTVILNAIYTKTGREGVLYQVRNLISSAAEEQRALFGTEDLFCFPYRFIRGTQMSGVVVGGNIRCLLKLAGTEYFPDLTDKILLLEAYSGEVAQMTAYLSQLKQLGAFEKVRGILLGTFTKLEQGGNGPSIEDLVCAATQASVPVAKTDRIGHGPDSRAVRIGGYYQFSAAECTEKQRKKAEKNCK